MIIIERYKLKTPAILDSWCFHLKKLCFHEKNMFQRYKNNFNIQEKNKILMIIYYWTNKLQPLTSALSYLPAISKTSPFTVPRSWVAINEHE